VALVGYTNVGKSTIMNLLSKSDVFAENKLFATLDTTVRKMGVENIPFLIADTVGFIRKLPHTLIESFKSTLDETREADILIHVVDISHPEFQEQIDIVDETLHEIGAGEKKVIYLFNKIDAFQFVSKDDDDLTPRTDENISLEELQKTWMAKENAAVIFISAKYNENIGLLKKTLYQKVRVIHTQRFPYNDLLYPDHS
jgi:GTP-binding protein HflX